MRVQIPRLLQAAKNAMLGIAALVAAMCWLPTFANAARTPVRPTPAGHRTRTVRHRRVRYRRHHITLPKAPARDRTEEIQSALGRGGYYKTEPTGKWDARTQEALREFQEANGLPPTGKLDALSLQRMGLGSDVAGVSAPRQSTAVNRLAPSSSYTPKSPGR
ncbi:MAG TPA: peptidoglycan-binding domain-containing protein [Candidatus Acidoferrales bacterium]|nr:peptidoglycan-binding domain-containing protein [Candidatus Acidoferrales bacterium]